MNVEFEGREARGDDPRAATIRRDQCPYPEGSKEARSWTIGWNWQNDMLHEKEDERRKSRGLIWAVGMGIAVPLMWGVTGQDPMRGDAFSEIGGVVVWAGLVFGTYKFVRNL